MRLKINFYPTLLLVIILNVLVNITSAQTLTYKYIITNESQPDSSTYEFEVFLLSTGTDTLELSYAAFGIGWDTTILNGGVQTYSIVTTVNGDPLQPAPSELLSSQVPNNLPLGGTVFNFASYPGTYYRFFNCAARTPPGAGSGTIISSVANGCTHPGTRIARFRISNSVPFRSNSTCKHIWSSSVGSNRTNTAINAYDPNGTGAIIDITNHADNVNFNFPSTCVTQPYGIVLNPFNTSVPENNLIVSKAVIFPQPSTGEITIVLNRSSNIVHRFNVYDLQGKLVMNHSFFGDEYRFDVGSLSGLYFIDFPEENIHAKMVVE